MTPSPSVASPASRALADAMVLREMQERSRCIIRKSRSVVMIGFSTAFGAACHEPMQPLPARRSAVALRPCLRIGSRRRETPPAIGVQRASAAGRGRRMRVTMNSTGATAGMDGPDGVWNCAEAGDSPATTSVPAAAGTRTTLSRSPSSGIRRLDSSRESLQQLGFATLGLVDASRLYVTEAADALGQRRDLDGNCVIRVVEIGNQ